MHAGQNAVTLPNSRKDRRGDGVTLLVHSSISSSLYPQYTSVKGTKSVKIDMFEIDFFAFNESRRNHLQLATDKI